MGERNKIPEKVSRELWIRSAGRCELCNRDLTAAYLSRGRFGNYSQMAHIVAYSEKGPRAVEFASKDNSYNNLMLLCHDCHKTIDDNPGEFTIEYLKAAKQEHCDRVRKALDMLTNEQYVLIEYSSTVFGNNERISGDGIYTALCDAGLYCSDKRIILEDRNGESEHVLGVLEQNFKKRICSEWDDGSSPKYCIFAFGPMYCLIRLGSFFSNYRNEIKIAIKTRRKWILMETEPSLEYLINEPGCKFSSDEVVLEVNISIPSNTAEIDRHFPNAEKWEITVKNPGIDIITDLADVRSFGKTVTETLDRIKRKHPEGVVVHVIPRMCNALAVQFGMSVMPKVHTAVKIYDVTKDGIVFKFDL